MKHGRIRYDRVSRWLHWLMATLIIGMLACGLLFSVMPMEWKLTAVEWHKSIGIIILILLLSRLVWRSAHPAPRLPNGFSFMLTYATKLAHFGLYALMLAMPLTGWLMVSAFDKPIDFLGSVLLPNLVEKDRIWAVAYKGWHETAGYLFIGLIAAHILAALYHHFIRRDTILSRML